MNSLSNRVARLELSAPSNRCRIGVGILDRDSNGAVVAVTFGADRTTRRGTQTDAEVMRSALGAAGPFEQVLWVDFVDADQGEAR